jgi:MORN repeat
VFSLFLLDSWILYILLVFFLDVGIHSHVVFTHLFFFLFFLSSPPLKLKYANGDLYFGMWRDDIRHGHGSYTEKATGLSYEGDWENDQPHGQGQLRDVKGLYSGQFCRGVRHGEGMLLNVDGVALRGRWEHGRREGEFTKQPLTATQDHVPDMLHFREDHLTVDEQVVYQPFIPHRPPNF